jgi:hypothetical protein
MPLLNYTTTVSALRTGGQVQELLAKAGASAITFLYEAGRIVGLSFSVNGEMFTLPVHAQRVYKKLLSQTIAPKYQTRDQAERVAWRIIKDWLEAQLAIIETGMVSLAEVMLPYMHVEGGRTVFQAYEEQRQLAERSET